MARVVMQAVVSVDGYIAYPDDTVGPLFDWYGNGDTEVSARASGWTFHVSQASADYVQPFWNTIKVTVIGRHLFDTTNGWDGDPAAGDELVVVTHRPLPQAWLAEHPDAPFHTAGSVEAGIALAKKLAGDGLVCVTAGDLGGQAFSAGHRPPRRSRPGGPGRPRAAPALHSPPLIGPPRWRLPDQARRQSPPPRGRTVVGRPTTRGVRPSPRRRRGAPALGAGPGSIEPANIVFAAPADSSLAEDRTGCWD